MLHDTRLAARVTAGDIVLSSAPKADVTRHEPVKTSVRRLCMVNSLREVIVRGESEQCARTVLSARYHLRFIRA